MAHSILNDVLGPVMRGPSSSHTAAAYHIGKTILPLLETTPSRVVVTFDPRGSYAQTYRQQNADKSFAAALAGWALTDERFEQALEAVAAQGWELVFRTAPIDEADHPNYMRIALEGGDRPLVVDAKSTGGGTFVVCRIAGGACAIDGKRYACVVFADAHWTPPDGEWTCLASADRASAAESVWLGEFVEPIDPEAFADSPHVHRVVAIPPVYAVPRGPVWFESASQAAETALRENLTLGTLGCRYEAALLAADEADVRDEMKRRLGVMRASVEQGLAGEGLRLKLLEPCAGEVFRGCSQPGAALGGMPSKAAARAMAVMHVANSAGVICAAPTGGSAGVLPGVLETLREMLDLDDDRLVDAAFAAGVVGLIVANRATFAAEVAGCQVEIGAAGAMAAAASVEAVGGTAEQALAAAAVSLRNTMGWPCDLVLGRCEIPCHTRNAAAAAGALVCADLARFGYRNPIPLDETIDASLAVGTSLPAELRCTSRGGLAIVPSVERLAARETQGGY